MLTIRWHLITPFFLGSTSVGLNILIRHSFTDLWVWITACVPWPLLLLSLSFLNWIKNEMIFYLIYELMVPTLILRYDKKIISFLIQFMIQFKNKKIRLDIACEFAYSAFDIFQKVVFCSVLYTEVNWQTFVMIKCKIISRNYLWMKKIILVIDF